MKTPTSTQFVAAATLAGAGIVGAKVSDGVAAIMPESTNSYKKAVLCAVGIGLAAFGATVKGLPGDAITGAGLGMAVKQGNDFVTDMIKPKLTVKDNSKLSGKFINGVVGYTTDEANAISGLNAMTKRALNSPFIEDNAEEIENIFARQDEPKEQMLKVAFV